jgi:APA family basic amino acid/polyamine antiporter
MVRKAKKIHSWNSATPSVAAERPEHDCKNDRNCRHPHAELVDRVERPSTSGRRQRREEPLDEKIVARVEDRAWPDTVRSEPDPCHHGADRDNHDSETRERNILEYTIAASAVSVGWSNCFVPLIERSFNIQIPVYLSKGYFAGGIINVPAVCIAALVTTLLVLGTRESAAVNAMLVCVKVTALALFIAFALPVIKMENFHPFAPLGALGIGGAAASIFFSYVGFDAVSTVAEETRNPQKNMPIGLIGCLLICSIFYLLVAGAAIGSIGAQPAMDAAGHGIEPGTAALVQACMDPVKAASLVCGDEPLAHVLRQIGRDKLSRLIGLAAFVALPSVILMMIFGQTRVFFSMARDRLLPEGLTRIHVRFNTPHVVTMITGSVVMAVAALFTVGRLADLSNGGTLAAFFAVGLGVMILRRTAGERKRPFRTPAIRIVGPLALIGCAALFCPLPLFTIAVFFGWAILGLVFYWLYGRKRSALAPGNS